MIGVLALAAGRIGAAAFPGMWLWGIGLLRFAGPFAWALAASPFVTLIPGAQTSLGRFLGGMGDRVGRSHAFAVLMAGSLVAVIAVALPDRSHFVGDFLIRFGPLSHGESNLGLFPQALPLDPWFHFRVPTALGPFLHRDPATVDRWTSVLKAGLLGVSGVILTRGLRLRGLPAVACWSIAVFSGSLAIFCGYSKGLVELTLFTSLFVGFGAIASSRGRGLAIATLAMVLALATHRAAAVLVPAWILLVVWSARELWSRGRIGRVEIVGSALAGLVAMAWSAMRIAATFAAVDRVHFLPAGSLPASLALTLAPLRLLDLGNTLLLMCPALPLTAFGGTGRGPADEARPIRWLAALAFMHAVAVFLVHPKQGPFRDWDLAAAPGVAISAWVAALVGTRLAHAPRSGQAASAIVAFVVSTTVAWMSLNASLARTITRVLAYVSEPPLKAAEPLGLAYRYLGIVYGDTGRPDAAEAMFARAATLVPSESNLALWAGIEVERGNLAEAQRIYRTAAARWRSYDAYLALARCSEAIRDTTEAERAAALALAIRPADARASELLDRLHARRQSEQPGSRSQRP